MMTPAKPPANVWRANVLFMTTVVAFGLTSLVQTTAVLAVVWKGGVFVGRVEQSITTMGERQERMLRLVEGIDARLRAVEVQVGRD